ncbi:hypothetical protein [Moraxella catarrhalis]|nr:hypothetical protein [Moraxella catarrhalis]
MQMPLDTAKSGQNSKLKTQNLNYQKVNYYEYCNIPRSSKPKAGRV